MKTDINILIEKLERLRDNGAKKVVLEIGTSNSDGEIDVKAVGSYDEIVKIYEVKRH